MPEYRELLQQLETEQQRTYDTTVVTLSGGALGISFAYVKDFIPPESADHQGLLFWAWMFWAFSIIAILVSHFVSVEMLRAAMRLHDAGKPQHRIRWADLVTAGLNLSAGVFFVLGVVLLAMFVSGNLGNQHGKANATSGAPGTTSSARPADPDGGRPQTSNPAAPEPAAGPAGTAPSDPAPAASSH